VSGRRLILATISALLAAAAIVPGAASARRDDKLAELFRPSNGAMVTDAVHGLIVDFTCPVYHQYTFDEVVTAPTAGYHVILSTSNVVDANRLLVQEGRVDVRDAVADDELPGHCGAAPDDADNGLMPPEPGRYYWQAYRDCATYVCAGGVEVTDVWSVTVRRTVCSVNRGELTKARADLKAARSALARRRTAGRRARVSRLTARVTTLHQRLRVVHDCRP
jgi:hypothetical protein